MWPRRGQCIGAPFLDETSWTILQRTPLIHLLRNLRGHAFSVDALDRLSSLIREARPRADEKPRFIFAHIMLPHPPLFVTNDCRIRVEEGLDEGNVYGPPGLKERRKAAYGEQIRCVNRRIEEFLEVVPSDSVVLLTGDHGPDSRGQFFRPRGTWTLDDIDERMSIFAAYRFSDLCGAQLQPRMTPVNSTRLLLRCLLGADLPPLADRFFAPPPFHDREPVLRPHRDHEAGRIPQMNNVNGTMSFWGCPL